MYEFDVAEMGNGEGRGGWKGRQGMLGDVGRGLFYCSKGCKGLKSEGREEGGRGGLTLTTEVLKCAVKRGGEE